MPNTNNKIYFWCHQCFHIEAHKPRVIRKIKYLKYKLASNFSGRIPPPGGAQIAINVL